LKLIVYIWFSSAFTQVAKSSKTMTKTITLIRYQLH